MPELPEVETIKRGLEKKIVGKTLKNIEVLNPKSIQFDPKKVRAKKVLKVWRRAKMLGIDLFSDLTLLFYLKMTGQLIFIDTENMFAQMPNKHTRATFHFTDGSTLYFNDQIKFGWVKIIQTSKIKDQKELKNLGPEPLNKNFTWQILKNNLLEHKNMSVKPALMDQSVVGGVGNIYASEALFLAKIDPRRSVKSLSDKEFKKLHKAILDVLKKGIKHRGATVRNYVDAEGKKGEFLPFASVYKRAGEPCKKCKAKIVRINLGGRGTYLCPICQK